MNREIAVNSTTLRTEVETMEKALEELKARIDEAYAATRELDRMWDGPANMAFQTAFQKDRTQMIEMCKSLEKLVASMSMSRVEYEKCEADVRTIVDSIRV